MNYMAHLFLSRIYPETVIGNFLTDMMTLSEIKEANNRIHTGVLLHRKIDTYTDGHESNLAMKRILRPYFHKYAGVALDLYYDYILYQNWDIYTDLGFRTFAQEQYTIIQDDFSISPERLQPRINKMLSGDFLFRYTTIEGQMFAFSRMDQRANFHTGFENAVEVLERYKRDLTDHFNQFFPDMVVEVERFMEELENIDYQT